MSFPFSPSLTTWSLALIFYHLCVQSTLSQTPPPHIPPPGIALRESDRQELITGVESLGKEIAGLKQKYATDPKRLALLPDVEVFHKAVDWAVRYNEVFETKQIDFAKTLLRQGHDRAVKLTRRWGWSI